MKMILGKKIGMTQIFSEAGEDYSGNCYRSRSGSRYSGKDS